MNVDDPHQKMSDNLFAIPAYEPVPPTQRPFCAWHRPRKQYIRSEQWRAQIGKLFDDLHKETGTLRYLGLPGSDLLDIRYFHSTICVPRNLTLLFLGFNSEAKDNSPAHIEQNISLDQVRKLPNVDPRSIILPDDIRTLANSASPGSKNAGNFGPYDVLNLDFCDGFAKQSPSIDGATLYQALGELLSLQFRNKDSWLLLLTTRTGNAHVHKEFLKTLVAAYRVNLTKCDEFRLHSETEFGIADSKALEVAIADDVQLLPVFLTGLCKWMVGIALGNSPPSAIEVKSIIGYTVAKSSPCEDLVSIAIRFTPQMVAVHDPAGIIKPVARASNECKLSVQALKRVAKRKNADLELSADAQLRQRMADGMAGLLQDARYDRESFVNWLSSIEGWTMS